MKTEIWRPINGYYGYYEISSIGRIRSLTREVKSKRGKRIIKGKILSPSTDINGYYIMRLYKNSIGKKFFIHRLVADAFIENPDNKPFVDHINTIRKDNRIENLRWCTQKENANNPITKIHSRERVYIEETYEKAKRTRKKKKTKNREREVFMYSTDGCFIKSFKSATAASKETGIDAGTIRGVCRGGRGKKSAGGYIWSRDVPCFCGYNPYEKKNKKVYQYDKDGRFLREWRSVKEAKLSLCINNISRCARGAKDCMAGGFWWRYYRVENLFNTISK